MTAPPEPASRQTLDSFSIVYFGNDWFAENRTSSHHVARCLAEQLPLLYVECPGIRAPQATARDFRKIFRVLSRTIAPPRPMGRQMWHMTMPQLPFRSLPFVDKLNFWAGKFLIRRAIKRLRLDKVLSWFVVPHAAQLAGQIGEQAVVYYCIDDYAAFPDMDRVRIAAMDELLTRTASQVFVSSHTLLEPKKKLSSFVAYSPHGVDIELFGKASDPATPLAPGLGTLTRPVIGYFGSIGAWTDLDLIAYLARQRPQWTFLLVGMASVDVSQVASLPNVILAGPQPYRDLPGWAKAFDVAIIPYRLTQQVLNASPLKIREYLATGKPVVTVPTPEIDRFADQVAIARSREQFLKQIETTLAEESPEKRARRLQAVSGMSWEARVHEAMQTVEQRLRSNN